MDTGATLKPEARGTLTGSEPNLAVALRSHGGPLPSLPGAQRGCSDVELAYTVPLPTMALLNS